MSLLDKIKSVLGVERTETESTGGSTQQTGESGVTVERETNTDTDTEDESDIDSGTDTTINTDTGDGSSTDTDTDTGTDTETDTDADTEEDEMEGSQPSEASGTMVDTDAGVETAEVAGQADTKTGPADEPGEATGPTGTDGPGPATGQGENVSGMDTEEEDTNAESIEEKPESEEYTESDTTETDPETESSGIEDQESDDEPVNVIKGVGSAYAETLGDADIESVSDLARADPETLAEETNISSKRLERWIGRAQHR
jgi:predicted flap endonuclease-1-like 5' DNA nuclease